MNEHQQLTILDLRLSWAKKRGTKLAILNAPLGSCELSGYRPN